MASTVSDRMNIARLMVPVGIYLIYRWVAGQRKRDKYFNMPDEELAESVKSGDRKAKQELQERTLRRKNESF